MKVTHDDLWLCHDCAIVTVNGDWSGVDDGSPEGAKIRRRIEQGLGELGAMGHLACDSAHEDEEEDAGERDFSWASCDCCASRLGGGRIRFAILGEEKCT